jgi:hypothetical protein
MLCTRQLHHIADRGPLFGYRQHMIGPSVERGALLRRPIVPLTHTSNAASAPLM